MIQHIVNKLNALSDDLLMVVDVGCHKGHFIEEFRSSVRKNLYTIGIDPLDFNITHKYNLYIQAAIANVDLPTTRTFYEHIEPGCSSLLKMNTEIISHEDQESPSKWFVPWEIEQVVNETPVVVSSLENLLDQIEKPIDTIHYLKVDSQGMDIKVVKSLRKYLEKTMFIQIESVISHSPDVVLYKGQQIMEQDIGSMYELGFILLDVIYHNPGFKVNEADVIFFNPKKVSCYENF